MDLGTGVLRNKLGISDQALLDQAEVQFVTPEIVRLTLDATRGVKSHTFDDFCQLHRELFGQIYEWAGSVRTIQISKGSTSFCRAEHITTEGLRIFDELKADGYLGGDMSHDDYIAKLAHYYSELNILHPFREGNGRTTRTFLSVLAYESRSMAIDWGKIASDKNIAACIEAYKGNEKPLVDVLSSVTFGVDK